MMCFFEAMMGLLGTETVCDSNRVWITKTHFPLQYMEEKSFHAQKVICVVRNPIDVIPSYAYLRSFVSHSVVPNEELHREFPEWWNEWILGVADAM